MAAVNWDVTEKVMDIGAVTVTFYPIGTVTLPL